MENRITHGSPNVAVEIDYKKLAEEFGKIQGTKEEEKAAIHAEQHRQLEELLAYKPLIIELAEDLREKREMRRKIIEKVTGALIIGAVLGLCAWAGRSALDSLDRALESNQSGKTEIHGQKETH